MTEAEVGFYLEKHVSRPEKLRKATLDTVLTPEVLRFLSEKEWGISIGVQSKLTPSIIETIKLLNQKCPYSRVATWILLPKEKGYWTNVLNLPATERAVNSVLKTAKEEGLRIDEIGVDLEFPLNLSDSMLNFSKDPVGFFTTFWRLRRKKAALIKKGARPIERFSDLVEEWKKQGVGVETYELPLPPSLLSALFVLTPEKDLEIRRFGMLYSSVFPPKTRRIKTPVFSLYALDAMKWLAKRKLHPALGVVSGKEKETAKDLGAPEAGELPCLTKKEFTNDILRLAEKKALKDRLYVYALGGKSGISLLQWTEEALSLATAS